jgi:cytochrome c biogenesis protein CcdA
MDKRVITDERSLGALCNAIFDNLHELFRSEILFVTAELREEARSASGPALGMAAGAALVFFGTGLLVLAAVILLSRLVEPWVAAVLGGSILILVGGALIAAGRRALLHTREEHAPAKELERVLGTRQ